MKFNKHRALAAMLAAICASAALESARASTPILVSTNRDLFLTFQESGANNDLEVDIGQASLYYNATPGSRINITQYSAAQLNTAFGNANNVTWAVGAAARVGDSGDPSVPVNTLWVTAPRTTPTSAAAPWVRNSSTFQANTASKIKTILDNASFYSGTVGANSVSNTPSAVLVPVGSDHEYGYFAGPLGNYGNTFQGDVQNTTPANFTTGGVVSRSDLYELRPDSTGTQPAGRYLGYFELGTNGTMVFVAGTTGPTAPTLSIAASGGTQTISFPSVANATYTLFYTNSAGLTSPIHTWPSVSTNITGDGTVKSFQQTSTDPARFYVVGVH
jgi:hypothetical protein